MADIYGRTADQFGGAFAADAAVITFGSLAAGGVGLLVQSASFMYTQQVTRIYEIGSNLSFYVGGRTQGQASVQRVLGPRMIVAGFYTQFGNVCNAGQNQLSITLGSSCLPTDPTLGGLDLLGYIDLVAMFCVITSIGVSVNAGDMIVNESLSLMFGSFNITG